VFLNKFTKAFWVCKRLPSLLLSIALASYCSFVTAASREAEECTKGILVSHTRAVMLCDCPINIKAYETMTLGLEFV